MLAFFNGGPLGIDAIRMPGGARLVALGRFQLASGMPLRLQAPPFS